MPLGVYDPLSEAVQPSSRPEPLLRPDTLARVLSLSLSLSLSLVSMQLGLLPRCCTLSDPEYLRDVLRTRLTTFTRERLGLCLDDTVADSGVPRGGWLIVGEILRI